MQRKREIKRVVGINDNVRARVIFVGCGQKMRKNSQLQADEIAKAFFMVNDKEMERVISSRIT